MEMSTWNAKSCHGSSEPLPDKEINSSEILICRLDQRISFGNKINQMKNGQHIPSSSTIGSSTPKIDKEGILRLSGRVDIAECVGAKAKILDPMCSSPS